MAKTYSEKLRDPRWQKRRLEVFNRDEFTCLYCGDKGSELQVHHTKYSGDPWQSELIDLQTCCVHCHCVISDLVKEDKSIVILKIVKRLQGNGSYAIFALVKRGIEAVYYYTYNSKGLTLDYLTSLDLIKELHNIFFPIPFKTVSNGEKR